MEGVTSILLKVMLFQSSGRGNSYDNATPKVKLDSNTWILGLSNEVSFVSGFFLKDGQDSQNVFLIILLYVYICRSVYHVKIFKKVLWIVCADCN